MDCITNIHPRSLLLSPSIKHWRNLCWISSKYHQMDYYSHQHRLTKIQTGSTSLVDHGDGGRLREMNAFINNYVFITYVYWRDRLNDRMDLLSFCPTGKMSRPFLGDISNSMGLPVEGGFPKLPCWSKGLIREESKPRGRLHKPFEKGSLSCTFWPRFIMLDIRQPAKISVSVSDYRGTIWTKYSDQNNREDAFLKIAQP